MVREMSPETKKVVDNLNKQFALFKRKLSKKQFHKVQSALCDAMQRKIDLTSEMFALTDAMHPVIETLPR